MSATAAAPVVVTAVEPLRHEARRAFAAWRALGLTATSFNPPAAHAALVAAGIDPGAPPLADEGLAGSPAPRLLAVLSQAIARHPGRALLIAGADLHPALDPALFGVLADIAPVIGLTREDCAIIEGHALSQPAPDRGGVAAVFVRADAADAFVRRLAAFPAARRLGFGLPATSLFLAAFARAWAGGRTLDPGVLLHERRAAAAADPSELAAAVGALHLLRATSATEPAAAAEDVAAALAADCAAAARLSEALRLMFYAPPRAAPASAAALAVAARMAALSGPVRWGVPFVALAALADRVIRGTAGRERIDAVLVGNAGAAAAPQELLAACLLERLCREHGAPPLAAPPPDAAAAGAGGDDLAAAAAALRETLAAGGPVDAACVAALAAAGGDEAQALLAALLAPPAAAAA